MSSQCYMFQLCFGSFWLADASWCIMGVPKPRCELLHALWTASYDSQKLLWQLNFMSNCIEMNVSLFTLSERTILEHSQEAAQASPSLPSTPPPHTNPPLDHSSPQVRLPHLHFDTSSRGAADVTSAQLFIPNDVMWCDRFGVLWVSPPTLRKKNWRTAPPPIGPSPVHPSQKAESQCSSVCVHEAH